MDFAFALLALFVVFAIIFSGYFSGSTLLIASGGMLLVIVALSGLWTGFEEVTMVNSTSLANGTLIEASVFSPVSNDLITGMLLFFVVMGLGLLVEVAGRSDLKVD